MKLHRLLSVIGMLIGTLSLEGCLEIDVQTKISPNGSSDRIITVQMDSESLPHSAFPIPVDPSWTIEKKKSGKDSSKYEYIARKHFNTPEELSSEYSAIPDTSILKIRVNIIKRFEWFYTYIKYEESYNLDNPFQRIPITAVLSENEIDSYRRGVEDDSLKARVDKWFMRNIYEDFFTDAVQCLEKKKDPSLPATTLIEKKEFIYNKIINDSTEGVDNLLKILEEIMKTKAVYLLRDEFDKLWKGIEAKSERLSSADGSYTNSVESPGLILVTNSDKIEGSRISWKFTSDQLRIGEYGMHAESRVTNVWAFMLTGIVGLFVLIIIVLMIRRR
jgi:hypothetical protein